MDSPLEHPVHAAILRSSKHRSIIRIKKRVNDTNKFTFLAIEFSEVWDEINHLYIKKKGSGDTPTHILKVTSDLSFNKVTNIANSMVQSCIFHDPLEQVDVPSVCKDCTRTLKNNYRPLSVLSTLSKF